MQQLPGDPTALAHRADDLSASALAIQDAAEALFALGFAGSSKALDVIAESADDLADKLKTVHTRYQGTASALATYAVDLQAAHVNANDAINDDRYAAAHADSAQDKMNDLRRERHTLESNGADNNALTEIDDEMRDQARIRDRFERQQYEASQQYARAQSALNAAAEEAIRRVDSALSSTNDGFWDHVGDFFAHIDRALAAVAMWVAQVLKAIIEGILIAIVAVVALLIVIVALWAIAHWIMLVFPLLVGIGIVLLLTFLIPGLESWRTRVLALLVGVAFPLIGGLILWRIASDVLAPDPTVTELKTGDLTSEAMKQAHRDANAMPGLYSLKDYMIAEGLTDKMGGVDPQDERGVVDIRKVVGPDGVERWVVTLPSTQDWGFPGDAGATNDIDSNFALMLTPELRTQYERAVFDAMRQAGIGKDDPIMLVGFSQGGIMAGHLAANRSSEYNFEAVLAYGDPIDAMNIPESTRVLSIQHTGDAVPWADLTNPKPNTPNHVTIQVDAFDGTVDPSSHANDKYVQTATYSPEFENYQHFFDEFSGTVVDQHQYTWQE